MSRSVPPRCNNLPQLRQEVSELKTELNEVFRKFLREVAECVDSVDNISHLKDAIRQKLRLAADQFDTLVKRYNWSIRPQLIVHQLSGEVRLLKLDADQLIELTYQKLCDAYDRFVKPLDQLDIN